MAFAVDPKVLSGVGSRLLGIADAAHKDASGLSGSVGADAASASGFASMAAALRLEEDWQGAVDAMGAKLASAADNLEMNANSYASTEAANHSLFPAI